MRVFGITKYLQPLWPCQKQPWTKTASPRPAMTMSGATVTYSQPWMGTRLQLEATQVQVTLRALPFGIFGTPSSYQWVVVSRPQGSTLSLAQAMGQEVIFAPDRAGSYVIEATALSTNGICEVGTYTINVQTAQMSGNFIRVELTWTTPNVTSNPDTNGTDLDLHYRHPAGTWNQAPLSIYWQNKTADWGTPGASDDPSLTLDDVNALGPEQIEHPNPQAGAVYNVGVYYYADRGLGESLATVRIFINGVLAREFLNKSLPSQQYFWDVALVSWSTQTVTPVDTVASVNW